MRFLFFLTFLGVLSIVGNCIRYIADKQYLACLQVLGIIPNIYTLIGICKWCGNDDFANRSWIANGYKFMFITQIILNIVVMIVMYVAIEWHMELMLED